MITKIGIENIKGYGIPGKIFDFELSPKRINLCIAPNGFGKSSLAKAFECLKRNRFEVDKEYKNQAHQNESSSLSIDLDGKTYIANSQKNEIDSALKVCVIHNRTQVDYIQRKIRNFHSVNAFIEIASIKICKSIKETKIRYTLAKFRKDFGKNGKIIENIDVLSNNPFMLCFASKIDEFKKMKSSTKKLLESINGKINELRGNKDRIKGQISREYFTAILSDPLYRDFTDLWNKLYQKENELDCFISFYLFFILVNDKTHLKELRERCKWLDYIFMKNKIDTDLKFLNSSYKNIKTVERDGELIVEFPHADEISNGQRDVLTLVLELLIFKRRIRQTNKYLLIIDEVFDYLDDANILAAQYYLSQIVKENKDNIYIILLSHLNPIYFRNYVFNYKMLNVVFLEGTIPLANETMKNFIAFREELGISNDENDKDLYDKLSGNLFHYNPNAGDLQNEIASRHKRNVKTSLGNPERLKKYLKEELDKYFSEQNNYDPYAVAMALRHKIEKQIYDKLENDELKKEFVNIHKTNDKLNFCEKYSIIVPDSFYIVNAIHNEADHLKRKDNGKFAEKTMVYKLQNMAIKNILKNLFDK